MAATSKYVAVVAIDFGTTYSGFAFSFNNKKGEGGIHMNREWGNDEGRRTMKTPTTILLTPTKKFDSFGYDADEKYVHFKREEQKRYYYFKHFKMELHKTKNLDRSTQLTATNGKTAEALLVFSLSIKYMKERAVEIIRERTGDERYTAKDIQWVITVPAIWTPAAKQFMREAAYKAGISSPDNSEQLIVALEPEGAAIFCRERKMRDFADEKGDASVSDVFTRPGSKYLMMDIGGGTLDVTAHEILDDGTIKEIHHVTGGPYGGIYVDDKFVSLLESLFGIPTVKNFRSSYPAEWLRMINDFEMKKRGRRAFEGKNTRIILPRDFARLVSDPKSASLSQSLERFGIHKDVEIYNGEYLSLGPNAMKQLFEPVVTGIVKHMTGLFMRPALGNVSSLFMVGGFAESVFLQESIKRAFRSRCKILIPNSANIAVVQGATMFGQKPTIVNSRIMATTYGFDVYENFDPKVHRLDKKEVIEGKVKCKDCFKVVVKENEAIKVGEKKCFLQHPIHSKQKKMAVDFFTSTDPKVKYISDPTVGPCIGKMTVSSPDTSKGKDRELEVSVYFGETEIKATAVDKTSGNTATAYLDFLCKS